MSNYQIVTSNHLKGKILRQDERYTVIDVEFLENLTLSRTILQPEQATGGHKHDDLEEIYIFESGEGFIELETEGNRIHVSEGSIVQIKGGVWHRVFNVSDCRSLSFLSIFQKYDRNSKG